jgi:hypothetical protein
MTSFTADGNVDITVEAGKEYVLSAFGTFGSGTLTANWLTPAGTAVAFRDGTANIAFTANGGAVLTAPTTRVRLTLAGSTSPALNALLVPFVLAKS